MRLTMKIILINNNTVGKEPFFFLKPDSALLKDNKPFFIPDFTKHLTFSLHPVIRICRLGKNIVERFAYRYYDAITIGLDLTAADVKQDSIEKRLPWEVSNSFDGSAVLGKFLSKETFLSLQNLHLKLDNEEKTIQKLFTADLLLSFDEIVAWTSRYYTMKTGDLIYCGCNIITEAYIGERLQGYLEQEKLFDFYIR